MAPFGVSFTKQFLQRLRGKANNGGGAFQSAVIAQTTAASSP